MNQRCVDLNRSCIDAYRENLEKLKSFSIRWPLRLLGILMQQQKIQNFRISCYCKIIHTVTRKPMHKTLSIRDETNIIKQVYHLCMIKSRYEIRRIIPLWRLITNQLWQTHIQCVTNIKTLFNFMSQLSQFQSMRIKLPVNTKFFPA